ncbi:NAD-dependent protein deacetylase sirtuin-2-like [Scyliorhinus canicula]|uniref:NAD-dependent protein deacetylase sirtuin-2-like n=1 Tax=Scyliorhinus canicula TaxID=7830 RepID=UPI0018F602ED|nr:NAD-dependent protein deacetylase sirtuin-2-like [Scyliorhinus canicula]
MCIATPIAPQTDDLVIITLAFAGACCAQIGCFVSNSDNSSKYLIDLKHFEMSSGHAEILNDEIPRCKTCLGIVKPDVVFFGESLAKDFFSYRKDFKRSDLLIVMGTSLETEPFASIVNSVQPHVPRLLLNWNPVGPFKKTPLKHTDVRKLGNLIDSVRVLVKLLGWATDLDELIKRETGASVQTRTDPGPMVLGNPELNKQAQTTRPSTYPHVASKFYKGPDIKAQGQNCGPSKTSSINNIEHCCIKSSSEEGSPVSEPSESETE